MLCKEGGSITVHYENLLDFCNHCCSIEYSTSNCRRLDKQDSKDKLVQEKQKQGFVPNDLVVRDAMEKRNSSVDPKVVKAKDL